MALENPFPSQLRSHVENLVEGQARSVEFPERLQRAALYIEKHFQAIGLNNTKQEFQFDGVKYWNVVGILNPQHKEIVVVGAHYDVCGDQPGADDNASGVAGLIEVARILKECETQLPYQIQFVAYSTEEPPYFRTEGMGSFQHARSLSQEGASVKLMICLEMIGYFSDEKKSQSYPSALLVPFFPNRGNFIAVVSKFGHGKYLRGLKKAFKQAGIAAEKLSAPASLQGIDFSDHLNYWKFGYKAVMVTDTSFYRNPNYHKPSDTIDTLDFERMGKVVEGVANYISALK